MGKIMLNSIEYSGGGNADIVRLTQAEYDALPSSKLTDDKVYMITDANGDGSQFQPVIYSEEEREIGVWVDGKPLYEKTWITTAPSSGDNTLVVDLSDYDVEYTVIQDAFIVAENGFNVTHHGSGSFVLWMRTKLVVAEPKDCIMCTVSNEAYYSGDMYITLRYTKTTDQAGSGTWTPQGVPAVHYSTDEQIVGTWIDGNTIYKKTFYNAGGVAQSLNIAHGINNLDKCIRYEGTAYDSNDSSRVYVLPRIDYGSVDIGIDHIDSTNIVVGINNNFQTRIIDIYITIYYTKTQGGT